MKKYVFFDLDGTLVPLDRREFEQALFRSMDGMFLRRFPDGAMIQERYKTSAGQAYQEGSDTVTVEEALWRLMDDGHGLRERVKPVLYRYYENEFNEISAVIHDPPPINGVVERVRQMGALPVLATNPVWPRGCIRTRLGWIGLKMEDFVLVSTCEDFHYLKPDVRYYQEMLQRLGAAPQECLMIGNDTDEDMAGALAAGIDVYLMTDYVMDRRDSIADYPHGTAKELIGQIGNLLRE